jgi:hypothetical protein
LVVKASVRGRCRGFRRFPNAPLLDADGCLRCGEDVGGDGPLQAADGLAAARVDEVEVPAGGVEVAVAEELADGGEVGAGGEGEGGGGAEERVRRDALRGSHRRAEALEEGLDRAHREARPSPRDEERSLPVGRPTSRDPGGEESGRRGVERQVERCAALPPHREERARGEVDLAHVEGDGLVDAQRRLRERREQCEVASRAA